MSAGSLWHPFASMGAVSRAPEFVISRGQGVYVWDQEGRRYLDAIASLWYSFVGYGRGEIADAVQRQLSTLHAWQTFGDNASPPALELAERIAAVAPVPGSKVFLTSGGSDSVDTAAKLARRYWHLAGQPERRVIIVRERAYHGMHGFGTSLAGLPPNREGYGPLLDDVICVPWGSADALADAITEVGPDRVAAFFCEPIVGAGGVLLPPAGYLSAVQATCRDNGVLFVADEVVTGFGRVGAWFASARFGLEPDMIIFAKGVTSGYLPLGGVVIAPTVADPFWAEGAPPWRHGYTYSGHSAACAAALANLDIIEREGLLDRALQLEELLAAALRPLADHPLVSEVRCGLGVVAAIQLDPARVAADPGLVPGAIPAIREAGVLSRLVAGQAYQASPPLVISDAQLGELAAGFAAALDTLAAGSG